MPEDTATTHWQANPVVKNPDGTFIVIHKAPWGELPYHVCAREVDPANAYDLAEVAAFWDSLPEGDPRKVVYVEPEIVDTRTPREKRKDAYKAEADPLFEQAMYYQAEAEGFRLLNDLASAAVAEEKSRDYLRQYAEVKAEIRERYPDEEVT